MKEIRKIIDEYDSIDYSVEKVALASVVNVEASSYRRIGARMLVRSSGMWTGGISGGCLEGDALKRSQKAIFKNAASNVVYDTMEGDTNQIGVGLGCNGRIEVLFTPIDPDDPDNEIEQLRKIIDSVEANLIFKIIDCSDSLGLLGKSKLIDLENTSFENIDPIELKNIRDLTIERKAARIFETKVKGEKIKLLAEFIRPETKLIVVGDNYDIAAILEFAQVLGWKSTVVGKAKKLSKGIFALCEEVLDYEQASSITVNEYTAVLLMSHDFDKDKLMLPIFTAKKPAYIGMLGPKKRYLKMQEQLGIDPASETSFFFSPTGLEIGAESPQEIALSMTAEIVAHMRNKRGGFLRDKAGSIHS